MTSQKISSTSNVNERKQVVFKALAYGHLDLLEEDDVQLISREELKVSLAKGGRAAKYFWELFEETTEDDVRLGVLARDFEDPTRRLFYSDPEVFEHYLLTRSLPILTFEDQSLIVMLTELPEQLLDFFPETFWSKLVGVMDTKNLYIFRMTARYYYTKESYSLSSRPLDGYFARFQVLSLRLQRGNTFVAASTKETALAYRRPWEGITNINMMFS